MWARVASIAVGIWLMAAPAVLAYGDPAATNDRIFGPTAAAFAVIAMSQVVRALRWANLPIGAWLVVAPFLIGYETTAAVSSMASGIALAALAAVRGQVSDSFGGGWISLLRANDGNRKSA